MVSSTRDRQVGASHATSLEGVSLPAIHVTIVNAGGFLRPTARSRKLPRLMRSPTRPQKTRQRAPGLSAALRGRRRYHAGMARTTSQCRIVGLLLGCWVTGVACCSSRVLSGDASSDEDGGPAFPSHPEVAPASPCSDLADKAPTIMAGCPTGGDCLRCADGGGGPIADGTYVAKSTLVWASGCGNLANIPMHATLRIRGSSMDIAGSGPTDFAGGYGSFNFHFTFTIAGDRVTMLQLCPARDPAVARTGSFYRVGPVGLYFENVPGLAGASLFVLK